MGAPAEVLKELRETRRGRHPRPRGMQLLALIEMALFAWGCGAAALWLVVEGPHLDAGTLATLARIGPGAIGVLVALLVAGSLRSGLHGGPLAPDRTDVLHLLLAPIERRLVVRPMAVRALLLAAGAGALAGATLGGVSPSRLGGNPAAWAVAGGVAGCLAGVLATAPAMIVSGLHAGRVLASAVGLIVGALSIVDVVTGSLLSPTSWVGAIALWPLRPEPLAAAAVPVVAVLAGLALLWAPGCPVEQLDRRAGLVQLLRFAASMLDARGFLRTRALLAQESPRRRPWVRTAWLPGGAVWQRHWRSVLRWPAWRVARIAALTLAAAGAIVLTWSGAPYLLVVAGVLTYVIGLEILEAWWQAVEHPSLTDLFPTPRSRLLTGHVLAAASTAALVGLVPLVALSAWLRPSAETIVASVIGLIPIAVAVAVASALKGRDGMTRLETIMQAMASPGQAVLDLPVTSGARAFRVVLPPALVTVGFAPLLVAHAAIAQGRDPFQGEITVAVVVIVGVTLTSLALRAMTLFTLEDS